MSEYIYYWPDGTWCWPEELDQIDAYIEGKTEVPAGYEASVSGAMRWPWSSEFRFRFDPPRGE